MQFVSCRSPTIPLPQIQPLAALAPPASLKCHTTSLTGVLISYATASSRLEYVELAHVVYASVSSVSFEPTIIGSCSSFLLFHQACNSPLPIHLHVSNPLTQLRQLLHSTLHHHSPLILPCLLRFLQIFHQILFVPACRFMCSDSQLRSVQSARGEVDTSQCAHGRDHVKFDR